VKSCSEIHDDETIEISSLAEVAKHECRLTDYCTIDGARQRPAVVVFRIVHALLAQRRIHTPQTDEVSNEREMPRVGFSRTLRPIQLAPSERRFTGRVGEAAGDLRRRDVRELAEELGTAAPNEPREIRRVVGEVQKGRGGEELLPLKDHWRLRKQEQQGRHRPIGGRRRELMLAQPERGVRDLIVILREIDEA